MCVLNEVHIYVLESIYSICLLSFYNIAPPLKQQPAHHLETIKKHDVEQQNQETEKKNKGRKQVKLI